MTIKKNSSNTQKLKTFLKILVFLKKYNYSDVRLLWWEPLLHPDIVRMLLLSLKWGFNVLVFSNLNLDTQYLRSIFTGLPSSIRINCNLNNRDFYSDVEYDRLVKNILLIQELGHEVIIGHNIYDISKPYIDIINMARKTWVRKINLKITNTIAWKDLIVDTSSKEYGTYLYSIVNLGKNDFEFEFSCGLSKDIFSQEQLHVLTSLKIPILTGCSGFAGKYDIDIDGSIYKCFPTRDFYMMKNLTIDTYNPHNMIITNFWIPESNDICSAHKV